MMFKCHNNDFYILFVIYIVSNISQKWKVDIVVNSENECIWDGKIFYKNQKLIVIWNASTHLDKTKWFRLIFHFLKLKFYQMKIFDYCIDVVR